METQRQTLYFVDFHPDPDWQTETEWGIYKPSPEPEEWRKVMLEPCVTRIRHEGGVPYKGWRQDGEAGHPGESWARGLLDAILKDGAIEPAYASLVDRWDRGEVLLSVTAPELEQFGKSDIEGVIDEVDQHPEAIVVVSVPATWISKKEGDHALGWLARRLLAVQPSSVIQKDFVRDDVDDDAAILVGSAAMSLLNIFRSIPMECRVTIPPASADLWTDCPFMGARHWLTLLSLFSPADALFHAFKWQAEAVSLNWGDGAGWTDVQNAADSAFIRPLDEDGYPGGFSGARVRALAEAVVAWGNRVQGRA